MIAKNRVSKYLLYAIGEIVLVVIGILIALSINSWNGQRKDRAKEQVLLRQLQKEYTANLIQLDKKIEMRVSMINSAQRLLQMVDDSSTVVEDSIVFYLGRTRYRPSFDPIKNDLINTGKLDLLGNEELKRLLTTWESDVAQLVEAEQLWWNVIAVRFQPLLNRHDLVRDLINAIWNNGTISLGMLEEKGFSNVVVGRSKYGGSFTALLQDPKLESFLARTIGSNSYVNIESMTLRRRIIDILSAVDQSIEK